MTLGTRYAAEVPERLSIHPGRTCGFAAEIFRSGRYAPEFGELLIDLEEDKAARAVVFGLLKEMERR